MEVDELRRQLEIELAEDDQSYNESDDGKSLELDAVSELYTADVQGTESDDWDDLMQSVRMVNERFHVVEESLLEGRGNVEVIEAKGSQWQDTTSMWATSNDNPSKPQIRDENEWQQLRELMDRIIDSIELSGPIVTTKKISMTTDSTTTCFMSVDFTSLPQLIVDDADDIVKYSPDITVMEDQSVSSPTFVRGTKEVDHNQKHHLEKVQHELSEAEDALRREAEEATRSAEEKKRQLYEKRRKMELELQEIKTINASVNMQRMWRGYLARRQYKVTAELRRIRLIEEQEAENQRLAAVAEAEKKLREEAAIAQQRLAKERKEEEERQAMQMKLELERQLELQLIEQRRQEEHRCREETESALMAAMEELSLLTCARGRDRGGKEEPDVEYDFDYGSDADMSECDDSDAVNESCNDVHPIGKNQQLSTVSRIIETAVRTPSAPAEKSEVAKRMIASGIRGMVTYWSDLVSNAARAVMSKQETAYRVATAAMHASESTNDVQRTLGEAVMTVTGALSGVEMKSPKRNTGRTPLLPSLSSPSNTPSSIARSMMSPSRPLLVTRGPMDALLGALNSYKCYEVRTSSCKRLSTFRRLAGTGTSTDLKANSFISSMSNRNPNNHSSSSKLSREEQEQLYSFGLRLPEETAPDVYRDISLCVESITDSSFLRAYSSTLRTLQLNVNKLRNLHGLEDMVLLEELSATDNAINDTVALSSLTSLRSLRLGDNHLTADAVAAALAGLPRLQTLSLNTNKLTSLPVLIGCDGLQRLEVYHNAITSVSIDALRALKSLVHLDMGRNKLESVSGEALSQCPLLQTLVLSQNALKRPPAPLYLPQLRTLWLSGNRLESLEDWQPKKSSDGGGDNWPIFLPLLEKLHLQDNSLTTVPATAVCNLPLLAHLDISFNAIVALNNLEGLAYLPMLNVFNVHDNPVYSTFFNDTRPGEFNELHNYLLHRCPCLRILSGNTLHRPNPIVRLPSVVVGVKPLVASVVNSDNMWELSSMDRGYILRAAEIVPDLSPLNTEGETQSNRLHEILAVYQNSIMTEGLRSQWPRYHSSQPLYHQLQVKAQSQEPTSTTFSENTPNNCGGPRGNDARLYNTSQSSRAFIQLLQGMCKEQNVMRAREKNETATMRKSEGAPNTAVEPTAVISLADDPRIVWETLCSQQILDQCEMLLSWTDQSTINEPRLVDMKAGTRDASVSPCVLRLVSFDELRSEEVVDSVSSTTIAVATTHIPTPTVPSSIKKDPEASHASSPATIQGVSKAQAAWRGFRLRRQVEGILMSSRYKDDDLDEMLAGTISGLDGHGNIDPSMDALEALGLGLDTYDDLLNPVTLRRDWNQQHQQQQQHNSHSNGFMDGNGRGSEMHVHDDAEDRDIGASASFVYGDHRRRGSFMKKSSREGGDVPDNPAGTLHIRQGSDHHHHHHRTASDHSGHGNIASVDMPWRPQVSRPSTSLTDTSSISASSRAHSEPDQDSASIRSLSAQHHVNDGVGIAELYGDRGDRSPVPPGVSMFTPTKSPRSRTTEALQEEWGISDPKVLQAMLKRNKKIKSFTTAKESRERDKDPEVRYQKFIKNSFKGGTGGTSSAIGAGSPAGAGGGGGGRGGAPLGSHMGSGRGRGGRFGHGGRKTVPMPAWAVGGDGQEDG